MRAENVVIDGAEYDNKSFIIGLALAVSSSLFIGGSFIIKKIALRKISASGNVRASAGGFAYLRQWLWWLGLVTMGLGEAANLLAYAFAPAALVTPLGALSVIVTAVLSSKILNEKLNIIGKVGCVLCIIGSIVIIIHSPKTEEIQSFPELVYMLSDSMFLSYVGIVVLMSGILKVAFVPRFGNSNISVYLLLCSGLGSLTVVFCKAVALGLKETISGPVNNLENYVFWLLLAAAVICIMTQMNYLNKSLDIFNTSVVTPVYYVMFTVFVIIASGIMFKEWYNIAFLDILGCLCGFSTVIIAVFMLNYFKDIDISFNDLNFNRRIRRSTHSGEALEANMLTRTR